MGTANLKPLKELTKEDIGFYLILQLLYDNGGINRWRDVPKEEDIPKEHFEEISLWGEFFFTNNPDKWNDDDIQNIIGGEENENKELYGNLQGYQKLNEALDNYLNSGLMVGL